MSTARLICWSADIPSLIADPKSPTLYTNRAMARLKMNLWDSVISDCNSCLELSDDNLKTQVKAHMKAHFYLSQAHLALKDYSEALEHAILAHKLCAEINDKSLQVITQQVLRTKHERWEDMERRRKREYAQVESDVLAVMERERNHLVHDATSPAERDEIAREWGQKVDALRGVFERSRAAEDKRRAVPDWAIDDISFGIMVDPVMVSSGWKAFLFSLPTITCLFFVLHNP